MMDFLLEEYVIVLPDGQTLSWFSSFKVMTIKGFSAQVEGFSPQKCSERSAVSNWNHFFEQQVWQPVDSNKKIKAQPRKNHHLEMVVSSNNISSCLSPVVVSDLYPPVTPIMKLVCLYGLPMAGGTRKHDLISVAFYSWIIAYHQRVIWMCLKRKCLGGVSLGRLILRHTRWNIAMTQHRKFESYS